jgi:hypothetical protein
MAWQAWRLTNGTVNPGLGTGAPPCFTPIPGVNATNIGIAGTRPATLVKRTDTSTPTSAAGSRSARRTSPAMPRRASSSSVTG